MKELLDAIRARPDDDAPRLAYADALPAGHPRAELIRAQIALAHESPYGERAASLRARASELLDAHCEEWIGNRWHAAFTRGFVDTLPFFDAANVARMDRIVSEEPTTGMNVGGVKDADFFAALAAWPGLARLSSLCFLSELSGILAQRFASFEAHLVGLDAATVAKKRHERKTGNWGKPPLAVLGALLAKLPPSVHALRLMGYDAEEGLDVLAASTSIERLVLEYCDVDDRLLSRLLSMQSLQSVGGLGLAGNRLGDDGARALAAWSGALRELSVGSTGIGPEGLAAILESHGARLTHLSIGAREPLGVLAPRSGDSTYGENRGANPWKRLDARALVQLAAAELPSLRSLDVSKLPFDDAAAVALARAPFAKQLVVFDAGETPVQAAGLGALREADALVNVRTLVLPTLSGTAGSLLRASLPHVAPTLRSFTTGYREPELDDATASMLVDAFTRASNLESVALPGASPDSTAALIASLAAFTPVRELTVASLAGATDVIVPATIESLTIGDFRTLQNVQVARIVVTGASHLRVLDIHPVDDDAAMELAAAAWPRLERLSIGGDRFGDRAVDALAAADMPALRYLCIKFSAVTATSLRTLADGLARFPQLAEIQLLSNEALLGEEEQYTDWNGTPVGGGRDWGPGVGPILERLRTKVRISV